jgi:hypothetical protein
LRTKMGEQTAEPPFPALVALAYDFVRSDLEYLRSLRAS